MPQSFPNWSLFILFFCSIFLLAITEGMHVACVQVAYRDFPSNYNSLYPNAMQIVKYQNRGNNLQHFLVGRQIVVVCCVFVLGRVTTSDVFFGLSNVAEWFISTYMYSGFAGVIITVILGQISPQIVSSKYPLNYLNIWFIKYIFYFCIFLEETGIANVVWLFGWLVFKIFKNKKESQMHIRLKDNISSGGGGIGGISGGGLQHNDDYYSKQQMLKYLDKLLISEDGDQEDGKTADDDDDDEDDFHTNININELHPLNAGGSRNIGGIGIRKEKKKKKILKDNNKTIQQAAQEFIDVGLEPPCFLKSLSDPDFIPPHLVALKLLEAHVHPQKHLTF